MINTLCVFCGSRTGNNEAYSEVARRLAQIFCQHNITLIYGAGSVGLMGILADTMINNHGKVVGVIPEHLCRDEIIHPNLYEIHVTDNLLNRKQIMIEQADAFLALPGGLGTFDEILEVCTWKQLHQHDKPIALMNIDGYFNPFITMLDAAVKEGFMQQQQIDNLIIETDIESLLMKMGIK